MVIILAGIESIRWLETLSAPFLILVGAGLLTWAVRRDLRDVIDARLPDERLVLDAARLKADHPMAYADAFGAALAVAEDATLWTGDPELLVDGSRWR